MKILLRDLPSVKEVKNYYQNILTVQETNQTLKVRYVIIEKEGIYINISYEDAVCVVPKFYQTLEYFHTTLEEYTLKVLPEYFEHFLNNYNHSAEYMRELAEEKRIELSK